MHTLKELALSLALCSTPFATQAQPGAVSDGVVRIGVLTDRSGTYADNAGNGSVLAARMAVQDFGGTVLGAPIDIVTADHQNKADIGASKAREWFDVNKVDMVTDLVNSGVALSVMKVAKEKNKILLITGSAATQITNEQCNDRTVQWVYNTRALANSTVKAVMARGGDSWYFLTADFSFGHDLQKDASEVIRGNGGHVIGAVRHPTNSSDFSSYMLQAQASKANVVGLANAGADMINSVKTARDFGLVKLQTLVGLMVFATDVHSLGLATAQGMLLTEPFYWDLNDKSRAWSKRFFEQHKRMPSSIQAGTYSAVMHYLKSIKTAGTDETAAVLKAMKATPVNDVFTAHGVIRDDGQMVSDMYLFEVKKPSESKTPWDYYKKLATIPGEQAYQSLANSKCALVAKK